MLECAHRRFRAVEHCPICELEEERDKARAALSASERFRTEDAQEPIEELVSARRSAQMAALAADRLQRERDEARDLLCEAIGLWCSSEDWPSVFEDWWLAKKAAHPWMEPRWKGEPADAS